METVNIALFLIPSLVVIGALARLVGSSKGGNSVSTSDMLPIIAIIGVTLIAIVLIANKAP